MQAYLIEHYGDIASVVALVVTFVGFGITIGSVRKATRAAEAAQRDAKHVIARVLLGEMIAAPLRSFRDIESACRNFRWDEVPDRCDEARTTLLRCRANPRLSEEERREIDSTVAFLGMFLNYAEERKLAESPKPITKANARQLHEIIVFLGQVQSRLLLDPMEATP